MRTIVAGRVAFSSVEFAELAMGIDPELFAGVVGETEAERAARMDAARDMLAELWRADPDAAAFAAGLLGDAADVVRLPPRRAAAGRWAA